MWTTRRLAPRSGPDFRDDPNFVNNPDYVESDGYDGDEESQLQSKHVEKKEKEIKSKHKSASLFKPTTG